MSKDTIQDYIDRYFDEKIEHYEEIIEILRGNITLILEPYSDEITKAKVVKAYIRGNLIKNPNSELRLGQKLENYLENSGCSRENLHARLFHMSDEEFMQALNEDVKYGIP